MYNSAVIYWEFITQIWLLGMELDMIFLFFFFFKILIVTHMIQSKKEIFVFFDQAYFISLIPYSNKNAMNFIIVILAYSVAILPEWREIWRE